MNNESQYGISQSDIQEIISAIVQNDKITKIILFGSRAKGNFKAGSDIDLALVGLDLKLNDILDATIEIEKLNLPYKFDLIIYNRITESALIEHIERKGIILYNK